MSLKAFHVFFVMIAVLMSALCGIWGVREYLDVRETGPLVFAVVSIAAGVLIAVYGVWFLRKNKHVSYI